MSERKHFKSLEDAVKNGRITDVIPEATANEDHFDMADVRPYLVEGLFPIGEMHIVCGSSNAGKTRLVLPWIIEILEGGSVLGHNCNPPKKLLYASLDRGMMQVLSTISKIGLKEKWLEHEIPILTKYNMIFEIKKQLPEFTLEMLKLTDLMVLSPDSDVFVVEGMSTFLPDQGRNGYKAMIDYLSEQAGVFEERGKTLIGMMHTPKANIEGGAVNIREKVLGSVAIGACFGTVIHIGYSAIEGEVGNKRVIAVSNKQDAARIYLSTFDNEGVLSNPDEVLDSQEILMLTGANQGWTKKERNKVREGEDKGGRPPAKAELLDTNIMHFIDDKKEGDLLALEFIQEWGESLGVSESTIYRWLRYSPYFEKVSPGFYRVKKPSVN